MGPSPESDGKVLTSNGRGRSAASFNGASPESDGKLRTSARKESCCACFDGAQQRLSRKTWRPLAEIMMSAVNRPPLVATIGKQAPWMMTWRTVGGMERNLRCSARAKAQSRARQRE